MKKCTVVPSVALALCGLASASIIPSSPTTASSLGVTTYSYTLSLSANEQIITGDTFCFADVLDLTGTPTAPTGWTATDEPSSACPHTAGITNGNNAPAVLYTYTGGTTITATGSLGTFTFQSTLSGVGTNNIGWGAFTDSTNDTGPILDAGDADGPTSSSPEPVSFGLMGGSLIGLGLLGKRLLRAKK
jgi:hypothetical protein